MSELHPDLLADGVAYADQWLTYQQERREVPGIVVAIQHDDCVLLSKGYGYADLDQQVPMSSRHIFRIASHSKTFTATAIMQLAEQGKLRLDDPLAAHIPWLAQANLAQATVRQALNHTAGIIRDGRDTDHWQLIHEFPDSEGLRRIVEDGGVVFSPNETFKYSNIGYSLLGLVIEHASGLSYHDYVKAHIIAPLGLTDTGPETDDHARAHLTKGYTARHLGLPRRPIPDISTRAMAAATGFYSTAEDLCRYAAAHYFGNDTLLSDASKREMQHPYWVVEQADEQYGLGFNVVQIGDRQLIGHGGGFPGHITRTMIDPRDRLVVVVLTNESGGPAGALASTIVKILNFALQQLPSVASSLPLDRFTGRFASMGGILDVARFGTTLVSLNPDADDPISLVTRLGVIDDTSLRISSTAGYGSQGEDVHYERDATGSTRKVIFAGSSVYPLDLFRENYLRQ